MDSVDSTRRKVDAALQTVEALSAGHFPQGDSRAVLDAIKAIFQGHKEQVDNLATGGPATVAGPEYHKLVLTDLFLYLPILGFVHRSKNPKNAFEIYGPLRSLAQTVITDQTQLVLSSEWEYSPYTLLEMPGLDQFVLVGLPASEATNALLASLAGHEFGHSVWVDKDLSSRFGPTITDQIFLNIRARWHDFHSHYPMINEATLTTDPNALDTVRPAARWCLGQCEEMFCDLFGLRVFGESFLNAFWYLLSPGPKTPRARHYPTIRQRAVFLDRTAREWGIPVPADYTARFEDYPMPFPAAEEFLLSMSDLTTDSHRPIIAQSVCDHLDTCNIKPPTTAEIEQVLARLRLLIPASDASGLPALLSAGWRASADPTLWSEYKDIGEKRPAILNELLLKSAQILHITPSLRVS